MVHIVQDEFTSDDDKITRLATNIALVLSGLTVVYCKKWEECEYVMRALKRRGIAEVTLVPMAVKRGEFLKHIATINGKAVVCTTRGRNIDFLVNAGFRASVIVHWDQEVDQQEKYVREQACKTDGVIITMIPKKTHNPFEYTPVIRMGTASAVPAYAPAPASSVQMATPHPSDLDRELDAQYDFIVARWNAKKDAIRALNEEKSALQNEILDLRNRLERACVELQATKAELQKKNEALEATNAEKLTSTKEGCRLS
ncbi:hypothetical protein Pelo_4482 [Pelomyxa schiedti]|nr:hypothetical protein Pelo_4482 [Pelomyxa schiedti]